MRGLALLAIGASVAIYGATLGAWGGITLVAMGGVALIGGGGILYLARTPRIEHVDRRRVARVWSAGMLVALGVVAAISGAALPMPLWIALGVVMMLFGVAIGYVAVRGSSSPPPPDRPDN